MQRILNEELTNIWLFDAVWALATKDSVHGFQDAVDSNTISRLEPKTCGARCGWSSSAFGELPRPKSTTVNTPVHSRAHLTGCVRCGGGTR